MKVLRMNDEAFRFLWELVLTQGASSGHPAHVQSAITEIREALIAAEDEEEQ